MKSEDLYHAVTDLRDDQMLEGDKKLKNNRPRRMFWLGGIAAALALVILGVLNGGLRDVLVKAANICTECIGLG